MDEWPAMLITKKQKGEPKHCQCAIVVKTSASVHSVHSELNSKIILKFTFSKLLDFNCKVTVYLH